MLMRILAALAGLMLLAPDQALGAQGRKRKKKAEEEVTQTLPVPKEPPGAMVAETERLVFHVSSLSSKGLLSQQVRDALKSLQSQTRGAAIVRLRAFVAGTGDLRRVQAIVSDTFTAKRLALPTLTVVQVGGLPLEGAQVLLESTAAAKKAVNPHGLAFVSGQAVAVDKPLEPVKPLLEKSLASLRTVAEPADVVRVTCFASSLDEAPLLRQRLRQSFPQAAVGYVQVQRAPVRSVAECEAVVRLRKPVGSPLKLVNPPGLPQSPAYSQMALVGAPRVAFSGAQIAFGYEEKDARLAFQRLEKALEGVQARLADVAVANIYPLSTAITETVRRIRFDFFDRARPPAATMLTFEGLPSLDGAFAIDVLAVMESGPR